MFHKPDSKCHLKIGADHNRGLTCKHFYSCNLWPQQAKPAQQPAHCMETSVYALALSIVAFFNVAISNYCDLFIICFRVFVILFYNCIRISKHSSLCTARTEERMQWPCWLIC